MKAIDKVYAEAPKHGEFGKLVLRALRDAGAENYRNSQEAGRAQSFIASHGLWPEYRDVLRADRD